MLISMQAVELPFRRGRRPGINSRHRLMEPHDKSAGRPPVFWRVEGSLLNWSAVRPVAFFARNAQTFVERWARLGGLGMLALVRPLLYVTDRIFATRVLHTLLRGVSQDRLDLLGEEYFQYVLKSQLKQQGIEKLKEYRASSGPVVLVSQCLEHAM